MKETMYAVFFGKEKMPRLIKNRYRECTTYLQCGGVIKRVIVEWKPRKKSFEVWSLERINHSIQ